MPRVPKATHKTAPDAAAETRIHAGTSGWAYPTWKPAFYPEGTPAKRFLEYYASRLTSVEVNHTFRALPTAKMLEGWLAATPADFRFSFKAPQRITHFKRLRECTGDLTQFFAELQPVRDAGKMGLVLFQLSPNFTADAALLQSFLAEIAAIGESRLAFEFRHESWFSEDIYSALRLHNAALCIAESEELVTPEIHTAADYTCYRLRRSGGYTPAEVDAFAGRFCGLAKERDVFAYFRHEDEPTGALQASALLEQVRRQAQS